MMRRSRSRLVARPGFGRGFHVAVVIALMMEANVMAKPLNFDDAAIGAPPDGWTLTMTGKGQPKWTIETEATAPSKPNVLKQSGQATFPAALRKGTRIR